MSPALFGRKQYASCQKGGASRPTWAEIDLDAVARNYHAIKSHLSRGTHILAVVKANAYGFGMVEVARRLSKEKTAYLGVASVDEGIHLRKAGIEFPILVLTSILAHEIKEALASNLTLTVCERELAAEIDKTARRMNKAASVHVKVDTGMGRLGVWYDEADFLIDDILRFKNIILEGIFTHFASADEEEVRYTVAQINNFKRLVTLIEVKGVRIKYVHAANSAGAILYKDSHFNMVRPGLMLYGLYPNEKTKKLIELKPAFSLKTKIIFLKKTPAGRNISYGRTYTTHEETMVATLPIGYADGLNRRLSNKSHVLVRGKRCPIIGKICMDHTMIDVTHVRGAALEDEVVVIGRQGREEITVEETARILETIPYEVVCWISARVPRVYI